jgi:heme A synthase
LLLLLLSQTLLGAATWVTRFGWPRTGYVSVQHAPLQIVVRTSHTVLGLLLFTTAVIYLLKILRLGYLQSRHEPTGPGHPILVSGRAALSVEGGVG